MTKIKTEMKDDKVEIAKIRFLDCIVCAPSDMPIEEVAERVRAFNTAGTTAGWQPISEQDMQEHPNRRPIPCSDKPNHTHHILVC